MRNKNKHQKKFELFTNVFESYGKSFGREEGYSSRCDLLFYQSIETVDHKYNTDFTITI